MIGDGWNMNQGFVPDTFYRDRILSAEAAAENARAARMRALDEALQAVRSSDRDVLSPAEQDALDAAQLTVDDLRRTW